MNKLTWFFCLGNYFILLPSVTVADVCGNYANQAIADYKIKTGPNCATKNSMGPVGRWSNNYNAHYDWCKTAGSKAPADEEAARKAELRACNKTDSLAYNCAENYGLPSVTNIDFNRDKRCGFSGPRWYYGKNDPETAYVHYSWCLGAPAGAATHEFQMRQIYIQLCQNNRATVDCYHYAQKAVQDQLANTQLGCGFSGPAWQTNLDNHLYWCDGQNNPHVNPGAPGDQESMRGRQLANCKAQAAQNPRPSNCKIDVTLTMTGCENVDGSPSEYVTPITVPACGATEADAVNNAKNVLLSVGYTPTDQPNEGEPGKCTYSIE